MTDTKTGFYQRPPAMRYISRVDTTRQHGYYVRLGQRTDKYVSKFFSDFRYKNKTACLKAAQRFRNRMAWTLFENRRLRIMYRFPNRPVLSYLPGSVSVCIRRKSYFTRNGKTYGPYTSRQWIVRWVPAPNQTKIKCFSVRKYGEARAKQLAYSFYRKLLGQHA
jgi:hypothetical protein